MEGGQGLLLDCCPHPSLPSSALYKLGTASPIYGAIVGFEVDMERTQCTVHSVSMDCDGHQGLCPCLLFPRDLFIYLFILKKIT